ncbi:MAG: hypothetical protein AB8F34_14485 [Akkermansiaceae bacterium]
MQWHTRPTSFLLILHDLTLPPILIVPANGLAQHDVDGVGGAPREKESGNRAQNSKGRPHGVTVSGFVFWVR